MNISFLVEGGIVSPPLEGVICSVQMDGVATTQKYKPALRSSHEEPAMPLFDLRSLTMKIQICAHQTVLLRRPFLKVCHV